MPIGFNTDVSPNVAREAYDQATQKPLGLGSSVYNNLLEGFLSPFYGAESLGKTLSDHPAPSNLDAYLGSLQLQQDRVPAGIGKDISGLVGGLAGAALNPLTLVSLGVGGIAGGIAGKALGTTLGKTAGLLGGDIVGGAVPLSANVAGRLGTAGGGFAGFSLPIDLGTEYQTSANKINYHGVFKDFGENLGIGMALGVVPAAFGLLKGKLSKEGVPIEPFSEDEKVFDELYKKSDRTPEENSLLSAKGQAILKEHKADVDEINNTVNLSLLTKEDLSNIASVLPYELAANVEGKANTFITDYIMKNALNKITSRPELIESLEGMVALHEGVIKDFPKDVGELDEKIANNLEAETRAHFKDKAPEAVDDFLKDTKENIRTIKNQAEKGEDFKGSLAYNALRHSDDIPAIKAALYRASNTLNMVKVKSFADVAKSLIEYAKNAKPDEKSMLDLAKSYVDGKAKKNVEDILDESEIGQIENEVADLTKEDIKSFAESIPEEDEREEIKQAIDKYSQLEGGLKPFKDFIGCVTGNV